MQTCVGHAKKLSYIQTFSRYGSPDQDKIWRAPTIDELSTIIDMKEKRTKINPHIFPDVSEDDSIFWTVNWKESTFTWTVDFSRGLLDYTRNTKSFNEDKFSVRLVYSNPKPGSHGE